MDRSRKQAERRKSLTVPLNPGEQINIRFYGEDKSDILSEWFGTTEELRNLLNTGRRT